MASASRKKAEAPTAGPLDPRLATAYNIMQSAESKLGGGEGVEGIYGSISCTGMQRIFDSMRHSCGLDANSVLVDIGAGLGRPLLHALLLRPSVKAARGIELDEVKVAKAKAFIDQTVNELHRRGYAVVDGQQHQPHPEGVGRGDLAAAAADDGGGHRAHAAEGAAQLLPPKPVVECTSIEKVASLGNATHAYSFWEGIPAHARQAFGRLFAGSRHLKCVAVVQRAVRAPQHPAQLMETYGFGQLLLISNFPVRMSGSGASFQAYIFSKVPQATVNLFQSLRGATAAAATVATAAQQQPQLLPAAAPEGPARRGPAPPAARQRSLAALSVAAGGQEVVELDGGDGEDGIVTAAVVQLSPPQAAAAAAAQGEVVGAAPAAAQPALRRSARQSSSLGAAAAAAASLAGAGGAGTLAGFTRAVKGGRTPGAAGAARESAKLSPRSLVIKKGGTALARSQRSVGAVPAGAANQGVR